MSGDKVKTCGPSLVAFFDDHILVPDIKRPSTMPLQGMGIKLIFRFVDPKW